MEYEAIVNFISQVGFPIGVSCYLLYDRSKNIAKYTATMEDLVTKIEVLIAQHVSKE